MAFSFGHRLACLAIGLAFAVLDIQAALSLQTFENPPPQGLPLAYWTVAGGGPLASTDLDAATGERCLMVPAPTSSFTPEVRLATILLGDDPGFCDLWIKPVARTLTLNGSGQPTETTGVLYLDGAHFLFHREASRFSILARTRDAAGRPSWQRLGGFAGAPLDREIEDTGGRAKDWLRLTIRRDLIAETFDVWIGGRLVAIDLGLHREAGAAEFRLTHRPTDTPADGALAPMFLDDVQASPTHPLYADTDADAMPDVWESAYEASVQAGIDAITPDRDADLSTDNDGVFKIVEYLFGSRPNSLDSDADGIPDAVEIQHGLNPGSRLDAAMDKDGDGFSNLAEHQGQGNASISLPPVGPVTNVVYVKADQLGVQNGQYATPYSTLTAALQSPALMDGGRIVVRGEGGTLPAPGNSALAISRRVTLVGVNMAQVGLQGGAVFATVNIPAPSATPVFVCENILFDSGWGDDGGALRVYGTPGEVVLRQCRFTGCEAADDGGAVYAHAARLTIEDCWFYYCMAGGEGGAVHAEGDSRLTLRRTFFQNNHSDTDGGAVSLRGATLNPARFESCAFQANGAWRGGAIAAVEGADVTVVQSTFSANVASLAGMGGGLFGFSSATLVSVSGCIFWGNTANGATQPHLAGGTQSVGFTTLSGWTSTLGPVGTGNNASDPLFRVGTLVPSSTAMLDSSNPVANATTDFLNSPRWDAPGGAAGTTADRGAFEKQPDSDGDGMSDDWEVRYTLNPLEAADADSDADQDGYSNFEEFQAKTDPRNQTSLSAPVVFVSAASGTDWHPGPTPPAGTAAVSLQGTRSHPFKTIRRAILACATNRRIVLMDGTYAGIANTNLARSESWTWNPHLATSPLVSALSLDTKTIRGLNGPGRVTLDGGGTARIFDLNLWGGSVAATVTVQNLTLRRGYAGLAAGGQGGAIRAVGAPGSGLLNVSGCVLSGNAAASAGGAIHMNGAGLNLAKCTLAANEAPVGGALALLNLTPPASTTNSYASINTCRFAYNHAPQTSTTDGLGGAISAQASYFSTVSTRFDRNAAARHGGAIALLSHTGYYPPSISGGTVFVANAAASRGGAVYVTNAALLVSGTVFDANLAGTTGSTGEGGAVFLAHPSLTTVTSAGYSSRTHEFTATRFSNNTAGWRGGAVAMTDVSPLLTNCAFTENHAASLAAQGGAVAVAWEVAAGGAPTVPHHPPAPKLIHATFARNAAAEGSNVFSQPACAPWLINSLFTDGGGAPSTPSLVGPRQLWGAQLAAPDAFLYGEDAAARRNGIDFTGLIVPPSLAFDWFHLATPVRVPGDTSTTTGGVEPGPSVPFTRPSTDIDTEARPAAAGTFTLLRGCDEPRDGENPPDGLPDWFEKLGVDYSPHDALTGLHHIAPGGPTPQLPNNQPTNNPDADGYTISQELLHGGRPDFPESPFLGRDSDGDGLSDLHERLTPGLDWRDPDVNNDDIADGWAILNFGSLTCDPSGDPDGDGLNNAYEAGLGLNPQDYDSDGDGVPDAWELATGTDPLNIDSNGDGSPDVWGQIPRDSAGNLPVGLHQPTAEEPWYVERAWSSFDYDPGLHMFEWTNPASEWLGLWYEESMGPYSDRLLAPQFPIPFLVVPALPLREDLNTMYPHELVRPPYTVNRSLEFMKNHHMSRAQLVYYPLHGGFDSPTEAVATLLGNRQPAEAWRSQWFDAVDGWIGTPGSDTGENLHNAPTMGRAYQKWKRHYEGSSDTIAPEAGRVVSSLRLRCPLPGGAPQSVSQTFLRIRGHAGRIKKYEAVPSVLTHPITENNFTVTTATLTLDQGAQIGPALTLDPHHDTLLASTLPTLPAPAPNTNATLNYFELAQFDFLLPVEVVVRKNTEATAPDTGLLVKKGDVVTFNINGSAPASAFPLPPESVKWKTRQLKHDGTTTAWIDVAGQGAELEFTTNESGVFEAKAIVTPQGGQASEFPLIRKKDAPHADSSLGQVQDFHKAGAADYFGVADQQWQIDVRNKAFENLGSEYYKNQGECVVQGSTVAPNPSNKCNIFIYHKCGDAGAPVSLTRGGLPSFRTGPPLAIDWWNDNSGRMDNAGRTITSFDIPNWSRLPDGTMPQPGLVVAHPNLAGEPDQYLSHVGIFDYDGSWISAGFAKVNKYYHPKTSGYQPQGYRKYTRGN